MTTSNMESDPIFTCMICMEYPREPVNCRHCSQFVCTQCINDWFEQSTNNGGFSCPTCRTSNQLNDFIKLTWLSDHLKWVNDRTKELEHVKINQCSQHAKQEICIFCSTCSKPICGQCISSVFEGEHVGHDYSLLNAAQQRLLKAIDEKSKAVQSDLNQLEKCIEIKNSIIDHIKARRIEGLNQLEKFQANVKADIELETTYDLKKIQDEQDTLIAELDEYKKRQVMLKEQIESGDQIKLFQQEQQLLEQLSLRPKVPKVDKMDISGDIVRSPLVLPWQNGEFVIEHILTKCRIGERISSPEIRLDYDQYWTLIIYSNKRDPDADIYLSCVLRLSKGMPQLINYHFFIELVHHQYDDSKHNYSLSKTHHFEEGQLDGFDRFYKLNDLSNHGFLNLETDVIKFRFKLCPISIFEERKLLQWQIESYNKTERDRGEQDKEMKKIKDQLANLQEDYRENKLIIQSQHIQIKDLQRYNAELKRKREPSNHDCREKLIARNNRRPKLDQTRTVIYGHEKRYKN